MKKILLFLAFAAVVSCNSKAENPQTKNEEIKTETPKIVGADMDAHGCKTSAGYTWSVLRNDCVRIFEVGTRLDPVDSTGMSAFIILDKAQQKAELFTLLEKKPLLLKQVSRAEYANGNWLLKTQTKLAQLYYKKEVAFIQPEK